MKYLLDTHALLWYFLDSEKPPKETKVLINNGNNKCYVSIASLWELSIKSSLGRLEIISDLNSFFTLVENERFEVMPILPRYLAGIMNLPFHHKDPFDRLIIAQAQTEQLTLISKDLKFKDYDVSLLWDI